MNKKRILLIGIMLTAAFGAGSVPEAEAYQIKRIIHSSATMGANETFSVDLDDLNANGTPAENDADTLLGKPSAGIASVMLDQSKTFVYATTSDTNDVLNVSSIYTIVDDDHTITFSRFTGTSGAVVDYQVVEFVSGVTVISGITPFPDAGSTRASKKITIPTIDRTKAFAILSAKCYSATSNQTGRDSKWRFRTDFSATNKLRIQRVFNGGTTSNYKADVAYQIIAFDPSESNVDVQYGTTTLAAGAPGPTSATVDLGTPANCNGGTCHTVTQAKSFLFMSADWGNTNGNDGDEGYSPDGDLTGGNTLTFSRVATTFATNIDWFLVQLKDNNYTDSGRTAATTSATPNVTGRPPFTLERTLGTVAVSLNTAGSTSNPSLNVRAQPTGTTALNLTRTGTVSADIAWSLNEFPPLQVVQPNGSEGTWTVGSVYNINWEHADDMTVSGSCNSTTNRAVQIDGYVNGAYQNIYSSYSSGTTCMNADTYAWTIPDVLNSVNVIGTGFKVRVSAKENTGDLNGRNLDESDATITILGVMNIPTLSGTQPWLVGDTNRDINWKQYGNLGNIKINVSTDGTTWNDGTPTLANKGGVIATVTPSVGGSSPFSCSGAMNDLTCTYNWGRVGSPLPDLASDTLKVRILQTMANIGSSTNPNGTLIVFTSTAHGLSIGDTVQITGHDNSALTGGEVTGVVSSSNFAANTFSLTGVNGNNGAAGTAIGTISRGIKGTPILLKTSAPFEIRSSITVTHPLSTEGFNRGKAYTISTTPQTIQWTTNGTVSSVDIYLSYDNGVSYTVPDRIAAGYSGGSPYNWTLGANQILGTTCKIAVVKAGQDPLNSTIGDIAPDSTDVFSIIGSLSQTAPLASQANPTWKVGGAGPITWTIGGGSGVTLVDVQYATNCTGTNCATTGTWANLPGGFGLSLDATQNGWTWGTIDTALQGTQVGIKIKDQSNPSNVYDQKGPFSVKMGLSGIKSGGSNITTSQVFRVGTGYAITWTNSGTPPGGGLSLYYNINGGSYTAFSPDLTGLTNSATVTFPDSGFIDDNVTLKVFDPNDGTDTVNGVVLISPSIKVKADVTNVTLKKGASPSANYNYGDVMTIGWTVSPAGYTQNVDILYTKDNGTDSFGLPGTGQKIATVPATAGGANTTGSFDWTIDRTDVITGSASDRIRVVKSDDTDVVAESGNFQVKGRFAVNEPTGSPWLIGTNHSLTYTANGIANVEIMIATDGSTFNTIVPTTTATGSYSWNPLPNDFIGTLDSSSQVKFRIRNPADPTETSTTATTVSDIFVKKQFINVSPANNTTPVGTLYVDDNNVALSNIIWTSKGSTSNNVFLDYDTASGTGGYPNPMNGGASMSDAGGYVWSVPDITPPQIDIRVRVKSATDGTVLGQTSDFTIRGKIDQLTPSNSGLSYNYGAPIAITWWNHGTLGAMTIKLSTDGSTFPTTLKNLASTTNNALNSWTWTTGETGFPPAVGTTYKIKVEQDIDASNVNVPSANNFKVKGVLSLTTLTGADSGAKWANVSDLKAITWNKSPATFGDGIMELYYSTTGATTCNDGSWVNIDPSPGSFPNGTGASWDWLVPGGAISADIKLKLQTSAGCSDTFAISSATNASVKGGLSNLVVGSFPTLEIRPSPAYSISWTSNPSAQGNVNVNLYNNNGADFLRTLATVPSENSPYLYTIPNNELPNDYNNTMVIKVELVSDATGVHVDTTPFTMKKKYANVALPSGVLRVDDNTALLSGIGWNTYGNKSPAANYPVILSYDTSSGGGGFAGQINGGTSMPDTEAYTWQVPDSIGTGRVVRVKSSTFPANVLGDSGVFEIKGKLDTLTPGGGEVYNYNADIPISFYSHGSLGSVSIRLSTNGTTFPTVLKVLDGASTPALVNNGVNNWTWNAANDPVNFPPPVGITYKIKVEQDSDATNVSATSATNFRVKGVLNLTTASTNGIWGRIGTSQDITWTKSPATFADGAIQLFYSTTGATTCGDASWVSIPPDPNTTNGTPATWGWNIPDAAATSTLRLKLQTTSGCTDAFSISTAASASIKGNLTSLSIASFPTLEIRPAAYAVSWSSFPSAQGNVNINLYNGVTLQRTIATVGSETSPYSYVIPNNELSNDYDTDMEIKVELVTDATNIHVDSGPFTMLKKYANVALPSGILRVDDNAVGLSGISWNTYGNKVPASSYPVILSYDTNSGGGGFTGQINGGVSMNDNEAFTWQVPDSIGTGRVVRVKSSTFPANVFGDSSTFEIKGKIDTLTPAGGEIFNYGADIPISFYSHGSLGSVSIRLSTNGTTFPTVLKVLDGSSTPALVNNGVNSWTWNAANDPTNFPPAVGTTYKIKVEKDTDASNVNAVSTTNFIVKGVLNLTALTGANSNAKWANVSDVKAITWNKSPATFGDGIMQLFYSTTGATTCADGSWVNIDPSPGSFPNGTGASWDWTIPGGAISADLKLKLQTSTGCSDTFVISSATNASIKGGLSNLVIGSFPTLEIRPSPAYSISWTSNPSAQGNVNVNLYTNNGADLLRTLTTVPSENGSYSYTIPNGELSNDYNNTMVIKVELVSDATGVHVDSTPFTMKKKYANVALPSGILRVDDNTALLSGISWNTYGNKVPASSYPVILSYDTNSGSGGFTGQINGGVSMNDNEAYTWQVPDSIGTGRVVRVKSSTFPANVFGDSSTFEIKGQIDTLTPSNSGLIYDHNTPISISFYNHGSLGSVSIKMASDGTNFNTTLKVLDGASTPAIVNNGLNTWVWNAANDPVNFPPLPGTTYKIRVEKDTDASNVNVISANNFRVKGTLALTTANTDGLWANAGIAQDITWTKSPATYADNQIRLYYSTSAAITDDAAGCAHASWVNIAPNPNTTTGSPATWNWASVPAAAISGNFRLKIQDGTDCSQSFDINDATSAIVRGSLASLTTAGTPWLIGTNVNIGWASTPSAQGDVLVEYSLSGGAYQPVTGNAGTSTVASQTSPFPWTIQADALPNDFNNDVKVRVKLISDPNNVFVESASSFTIRKRYISVGVPSGVLYVGDVENITWDTQGNVPPPATIQVILSYDTASGGGGYGGLINAGGAMTDNETYGWTVADSIGLGRRIRVKSSAFPADVYGDMASDFTIRGKLLVTQPTAASTLVVGNLYTIQFDKRGTIGNVKIFYNRSGCGTPLEITPGGGTSNASSFDWNVAALDGCASNVIDASGSKNSSFFLVGATHEGDVNLEASTTTQNFQIRGEVYKSAAGDFVPNGGEVWANGTSQFIKWKTNGNVGNVRIRLDKYAGNGLNGTPNDGDEFTVILSGPSPQASGESIPYNYIDADCTGACSAGYTGVWEWDVPDEITSQARIRVESTVSGNSYSATNPMATYRVSEANFRVRGNILVTSPVTTLVKVGDNVSIDWTPTGTVGNVNISILFDNDGSPYGNTISIASGTSTKPYPYTIPANAAVSSYAVFRVTSVVDSLATDDSDEFKIFVPVTAPANSNQWVVGSNNTITWTPPTFDTPTFKVEVSLDGSTWPGTGDYLISAGAASAGGSIPWTIPSTTNLMTNAAKIRVSKVGDANAKAESGGLFYIKGSIANVTPANAIDLPIGANVPAKTITWNYTGAIGNVNLYYATDANPGPPTWVPVTGGASVSAGSGGAGTFDWDPIPGPTSPSVKVKVESVTNANWLQVSNESSGLNNIIGSITEVTVIGGNSMEVGLPKTIQWKRGGGDFNVGIKYRVDNGAWSADLTGGGVLGTPSGLYSQWEWPSVANNISDDVDFMVYDIAQPAKVLGISAKTRESNVKGYILKGRLSLTGPIGSDTWTLASTNNIAWDQYGTIGNIIIEFSANGGVSWQSVETNYAPPVGDGGKTYPWTAGVDSASNRRVAEAMLVRVTNVAADSDLTLTSTSAGFRVRASINSVSSPGSGVTWNVGTGQTITWSANSGQKWVTGAWEDPKIKLEYSADGGALTGVSGGGNVSCVNGANNFSWVSVADERSATGVTIRVAYLDHPTDRYLDSASFHIRPTITPSLVPDPTSSNPLGLAVGTNYPNLVRWTNTGTTIANVNVRYDVDGSDTFTGVIQNGVTVVTGATGVGWNIPSTTILTDTAKIRIIDVDNSNVYGDFGPFKVRGGLVLTAPTGSGTSWAAAGAVNNVTWNYVGAFSVEVRYDPNSGLGADGQVGGGDDYPTLIGTKAAPGTSTGSNSINWDMSTATGTNTTTVTNKGRVKIFNPSDPTNVVYVGNDFNVITVFDITAPENGAPVYAEDTDTDITWSPGLGTGVSDVKIEYSNNSSNPSPNWVEIDSGVVKPNSGTYRWSAVPALYADLNNDGQLRISQKVPLNAATLNYGLNAFPVKPILEVTSPGSAGNATLQVGAPYSLKLKKKGDVHAVDFYYSYDGTAPNYVKITPAPVDISGAPDVNGEYTYNWTPLESHTLTAGGFPAKIKAKVVDPGTQVSVEDVQSNGTKLTGGLVLNTPNLTNIILEVSDNYAITWTKYSVSNVRLFYSIDGGIAGGGTYPPDGSPNIATVAATPATRNWTVPDEIGTNLRVRIMDDDNALVAVESLNTFSIRGKLIMNTVLPTSLRVDDSQVIQWTPKGTMAPNTVRIEYSTDDFAPAGSTFPVLGPLGESAAALAPGANNVQQSFTWKVPDNISNSVKVRVTHNSDSNVKGTTTVASKIVGWYDITDPLGGVGVFKKVGDPFSVTWARHGSIAQAKVEYSTDGFQTDPANVFLIGTVNSPTQSISWPIPDAIGLNVKVRISDPAFNGTTVHTQPSSSAAFEIRGQIKFNPSRVVPGPDSPLGGEIWLIASDHLLQWEKYGTIGNVKVEYQVGGGPINYVADASATQATSVAGDTFNWRIPNQKGLNNVVVFVTALGDTNVTISSQTFTIRAGFSWTNPSAVGQVFEQGSTPTLTWNTNGTVPTVDMKYSTNGDAVYDGDADPNYVFMKDTLGFDADNIANNNTFNWPVPTNINASKTVYFVVVDSTDPDAKNVSPQVKIAGVLSMDEPDNNPTVERWGVTTNQTIAWTMVGNVANVKIEYTKDITAGTVIWETPAIASSVVASNLSYSWTNIPTAAVSAKAAIRVSDFITDSGTVAAISPLFKITGTFTPSAPATGNTWLTTGTNGALTNPTRNIVWTTQGTIANANLYFSTTGNTPGAWTLINGGGPIADGGAGGSYPWTVPQVFSENVVIRIQDSDDSLTYNDTGLFTVRGHINLTSPVGGELWGVGEVQSITWDSVGVVGTPNEVYIFYKKSAGGAWIQLQRPTLEYNIPNTGTFAWTPPESELSTTAYVKIENILAPTDAKYVSTESPAPFKLMRRYQLVDPDGGEVYVAGQAKDILWNTWGTPVGSVRIDLALDGTNFNTNISLTTPNDGIYSWTPLASQVAPAAKIRISDVNDTLYEKPYISGAPFVVRATLILDGMPATVNIGDVYDILWTRQGDIPNVKLVYTTTGNFALDSRNIEDLNGTPMAGGLVPNQDVISGNPTRGRHQWKVPDLILTERANLQLRLVDPNDDPGAQNISGQFRILPKFTVLTPNGNVDPNLTDKLKVGIPYDITWTSTSSNTADKTPNVTILYSVNGGGSYPNTITTTANTGTYNWFVPGTGGVPDDISSQVKVKVVSANAAEAAALAEDASNNNLKIISNLTLTAPNGGATYEVGDPFTISWTNIGSAANVSLVYSIAGADFSSPVTIVTPTGNDLSEPWVGGIPNAIGTDVRVRVKSTTDDGEDSSDTSFRIKGKITVSLPANGTPVPIGQTYRITWTNNGTIPNVDIVYDTQDGSGGYPGIIATGIANVGYFDWLNVPDASTANARIRVIDSRPTESDVIGTSARFNIVGNFTVLTPPNLDELVVNSNYNVTWHWGGTMQFVKVSYTTNPGLAENVPWTNITTIDYGPASGDGANGTATRTYVWTVPDNIAPQVRFKVENANDSTVYDVSTGTFRIKGGFAFQSPTGGERWVTNEARSVTWLTNGTVPFVNLQYSYDNFATAGVPIATNIANNGSGLTTTYPWTIHDPGITNVPKSTKLRIVDSADPTNVQVLGTAFNIDYYNITWEIRDLVTNASLSQLTVNEVKASDPNFVQWSEAGISTNPPRLQKTPYGTWVATWAKAGFGDGVQVVVANADQSILLYMETSTVHIWLADSQVSYTPATLTTPDKLDAVAWLSRDGSITTGAINAVFKIYDGPAQIPQSPLSDNTVDSAGFFNFSIPGPTGLVAGKTYTVICEITVGSGGVFKTPSSFEITAPAALQALKNTIDTNIDKPLSQINSELQTTLTAQTATITTKLDQQTAAINTTLTNFTNTIQSSIVSLESAATQSLASAQTLEDTALKFSWKAVVAPNPALTGTTIVLKAQGPAGLSPIVSVFNNDDDQVIINGLMFEDAARPGDYTYTFQADQGDFEPGQAYTYLVSEDVTGGLVAGSGFIESISLTSVAGLAAAAPAAEKAAKEAVKAIKDLEKQMAKGGDIADTMKLLKRAVEDLKYATNNTPERENKMMRERVAEMTEKLRELAGSEGLNFDQLFKKAIDESTSIQEIRSRAGSINQVVELIGAVVEKRLGGVEEPIVDVQLEPAT